jgi:ABC-type transporter Mla subunit MlaD
VPDPNFTNFTRVSRVDVTRVVGTLDQIQNVNTIDQLNQQRATFTAALTDLKTHLTDQDVQINNLTAAANANQATITTLQNQNDSLQQQVTSAKTTIDQLNARLAAATAAAQPAAPTALNLADSFRQAVDQIQTQARQQSGAGAATTIRSLDIEVKGLVNVDSQSGQTVMVLPTLGTPIDANQLSTLRVSFAAIPGAAGTPPATPPAGAAGPARPAPSAKTGGKNK